MREVGYEILDRHGRGVLGAHCCLKTGNGAVLDFLIDLTGRGGRAAYGGDDGLLEDVTVNHPEEEGGSQTNGDPFDVFFEKFQNLLHGDFRLALLYCCRCGWRRGRREVQQGQDGLGHEGNRPLPHEKGFTIQCQLDDRHIAVNVTRLAGVDRIDGNLIDVVNIDQAVLTQRLDELRNLAGVDFDDECELHDIIHWIGHAAGGRNREVLFQGLRVTAFEGCGWSGGGGTGGDHVDSDVGCWVHRNGQLDQMFHRSIENVFGFGVGFGDGFGDVLLDPKGEL